MKQTFTSLLFVLLLAACASSPHSLADSDSAAMSTLTPTPAPTMTPVPTRVVPAVVVTSGDWATPNIALTFDLCQDPAYPAGYDAAIIAVLERYNVPATFFMGGDWMRTHPEETKALASHPDFEMANHSWSHPSFLTLTAEEMAQQLDMTEQVLFELTGRHSRFFRPPAGEYNDLTLQVVSRHNMYTVLWDSVTGDPDPAFDADTILGEVQRTARNGSIVIMHANGRGWHTVEALPSVIEYLQGKGFRLVTMSELLELSEP